MYMHVVLLLAGSYLLVCETYQIPFSRYSASRFIRSNIKCVNGIDSPTTASTEEKLDAVSTIDPNADLVEKLEALKAETNATDLKLKSKRSELSLLQTQLSETGKNGYFMVQARVSNYLKEKANEQETRVQKNKKEFIENLLPILDLLEAANANLSAEFEKEMRMMKDFGSLAATMKSTIFLKNRYHEFFPDVNEPFRDTLHEIAGDEASASTGAARIVSSVVRPGVLGPDQSVMRKAQVKVANAVPAAPEIQP